MVQIIDTNSFYILGIPPYYFMAGLGFLFSFSIYMCLLARKGFSVNKNGIIVIISIVGLLFGAKIFGYITKVLVLYKEGNPVTIKALSESGIVFYGGLTGFIMTFLILQKMCFKEISKEVVNVAAISIPLFHSFARIGCFFGGCCYGKETSLSFIGVQYIVPNTTEIVNRIPIQLIESCLNLFIFVVLLVVYLKRKKEDLLILYLGMYATLRFFIEYFRGDISRGVFGVISFSQICSILIILIITLFIYRRKKI